MSHTWKFLPIAALFVLGAFMLLPGGASNPTPVSAVLDCDEEATLIIEIEDVATNDPVEFDGIEVQVSPDPYDLSSNEEFVDGGDEDSDDEPGTIELEDICGDDGVAPAGEYTVTFEPLPDIYEDCDIETDNVTETAPEDGDSVTIELQLDCEDADFPTPTPSATSTSAVGPAATINVSSSNDNLGCGATSIVTITVLDSGGDPVAAGTIVNIVADRGSVSPASGQTTADGSVFVFYTAPNNQGGDATITAASGSALGTTEIEVDCNTAPTQAPPPTQSTGGSIQPPNTGDGGLSTSNTWQPYAGVALILSSVIATLAVIRTRA